MLFFLYLCSIIENKIEAKNAELKNVLGYARAESYGMDAMQMQGAITMFAANVKRIIKLLEEAK